MMFRADAGTSGWRIGMMLAVLMTALVLGCQDDAFKAPPSPRDDPLPPGTYPRVIALEGLHKALVTGRPIVEKRSERTPLRVTVPVRSTADVMMNLQYKFEFFDSLGRPLDTRAGWRFIRIAPRTEVTLDASAVSQEAADWRVEIRPGR